jgi:hypothetical protein
VVLERAEDEVHGEVRREEHDDEDGGSESYCVIASSDQVRAEDRKGYEPSASDHRAGGQAHDRLRVVGGRRPARQDVVDDALNDPGERRRGVAEQRPGATAASPIAQRTRRAWRAVGTAGRRSREGRR